MEPNAPQISLIVDKANVVNIASGLSRTFNIILDAHGIPS